MGHAKHKGMGGWGDKAGRPWIWRGKFGGRIETPNFPRRIHGPPTIPPPPPLYDTSCAALTPHPPPLPLARTTGKALIMTETRRVVVARALFARTVRRHSPPSHASSRPRQPCLRGCNNVTCGREGEKVSGQQPAPLDHHPQPRITGPSQRSRKSGSKICGTNTSCCSDTGVALTKRGGGGGVSRRGRIVRVWGTCAKTKIPIVHQLRDCTSTSSTTANHKCIVTLP